MNKARARRLYTSGNTVLDDKGNIWNVLVMDSNIKSKRCWVQLSQLRNGKGYRRYDRMILGKPGRTLRIAQRHLIHKYYNDNFKNVEYDAINNKIKKIIE